MNVNDVLARKAHAGVESIGAQETIATLVDRLAEKRIGAMMVTGSDGELVGIVSERDVVRALATNREGGLSQPVARYMTTEVVTATPRDDAVEVLERMTHGRFRHMPVLNDGGVIGVVSIGDVVKARIEDLQRDNAALEEFIRS